MKMKKAVSLLLALSMLLSLCVTTAFAATSSSYTAGLTVTKVDDSKVSVSCDVGPSGASTNIQGAQNYIVAFDTTVFKPLLKNGTDTFELTTEPVSKAMAFYQWENPDSCETWTTNVYAYKSADGKTGFLIIQPGNAETANITAKISLAKVYLGFQSGKTFADVTTKSVRFATATELEGKSESKAIKFNDGTGSPYTWSNGGTGDTLTFAEGNEPTVTASGFDFVKPAISGSVAFRGDAKFGQTLTASTENLPNDAGALTYNWYRGTTLIEDESGSQYVIDDAADVDKTIKVEVTAANYSGKLEATSSAVVKADGPDAPAGLAEVSKTHNSITVTANAAWEYSRDNGTSWQASNVFTGLSPNTEYSIIARVKATDTHEASAASAALMVTTAKASADDKLKASLKAAVTAYNGDYDGTAHNAFTEDSTKLPDGWSVSGYSDSETGTFSAMPTVTNVADSKTLYVKFTNSDYSDVVLSYAVTVNAKSISGAVIAFGTQKTYSGSEQSVVITSVTVDGKALSSSDYDITAGGTATNVAQQTLTITGKGNYTGEKTTSEKWSLQAKSVTATMIGSIDSQTYTGNAITPALTVKDGDTTLTDAAYTASYENNTYVGTATATITGKGNYTGTASKSFSITSAAQTPTITTTKTLAKGGNTLDLSALVTGVKGDAAVSFSIASGDAATLSGSVLTSDMTKTGDVKLNVYIAEVDVNSDGKAEYQAYTGNAVITVSVTDKAVNRTTMTVSLDGWTYGSPNTPSVTGKPAGAGDVTYLYFGIDSTVYEESTTRPSNVGTYNVMARCETADTIYMDSADFTISPKSISGATVTLDKTTTEYSGSAQTVTVTVKDGETPLTAGTDYTVSGDTSGTDVGAYTVTVTGQGNYTGTATATWTITRKQITIIGANPNNRGYREGNLDVDIEEVSFNGTVGDAILIKGTDYDVVGRVETDTAANPKEYTITVTLKGDAASKYVLVSNTYTGNNFAIHWVNPATPTGLTGRTGNKLSTVSLPAGWSWDALDTVMAAGEQTYKASYAGSTNYQPVYNVDVTVNVTDKETQTLNVPDSITAAYGDTNVSVAPTGAHGAVTYTVTSDVVDVDGNGKVTILKAGTATVTVAAAGDADYASATKNVTITVSKARLTVTARDQSINVNGTLPDLTGADAYTVTGLVSGDTVDVSLAYAETPDVTKTGSYDIVVTVTGVDADKYELTKVNGTLTISQRSIPGVIISNYSITVEKAENGAVKADRSIASAGATVTLTVDPAKGYTLETLTVLDKSGKEVKLTAKGGKYTFTMPASNVVVKSTFMEDNSMLNFFVDVPASKYFYDAVLWAVENDITGGVDENHFAPYASCTRGQLVTFLWRAAGEPAAKTGVSFSDVAAGRYCEKAVAWAAENDIVGGYNDGSFRPDATITRQQTATILWRFAKYAKMDVSVGEDTNILSYTDALSISDYAFPAIQWAVGAGVMQGNDGALQPFGSCTRAQIVTMLYRLLSK